MMKSIGKKQKQSSSIHQKIRKASFVEFESEKKETFKYLLIHNLFQGLKTRLVAFKIFFNSLVQKANLFLDKFDWNKIKSDFIEWIFQVFVEGLTANFATHFLFGVRFNLGIILAHGIIIKQSLSIYSRFKQDGPTSNILKKNK